MNRVLVLSPDAERYVQLLRARALPDAHVEGAATADEARGAAARANVVLGKPALVAGILDQAEQLEWVQSTFAGVDALTAPGLRRDYRLTGLKEIFGPLMSEYVFGWILALERHVFELRAQQGRREWRPIPYRRLRGLTLGVAGLGSIGRAIAASGAHFGLRVVGWKRSAEPVPGVARVYAQDELEAFVRQPDYLVITLPSTPATRGVFDAGVFDVMAEDAVLINVGRGDVVAQHDLVSSLRKGDLRAAVLDVFEDEPLPSEHPLWTLSGAYVTPHTAADSFPEDIAGVFCDNYRRFHEGRELKYVVDFARGY